nr:LCP family protein [Sediminivirga luteola]
MTLLLLTLFLLAYTIVWALCFFDTLRLVRFVGLKPRVRAWVAGASALVLLIVGGGLAYGTGTLNSQRGLISDIFASGGAVQPVDGRYNILLLGSDAGKGREGIRPDSITVVSIDARTGQAVMFGIPRNMQNVPFPEDSPLHQVYPQGYNCGDECLINSVYLQGQEHAELYPDVDDPGAQAMIDAASGVTGLEVQFYAMIDMDGFAGLIDAVGGITIVSGQRVPMDSVLTSVDAEPEHGWIEIGEQRMDGRTALWFARSRRGSSDYERMARQRCVQEAMLSQLEPATLLTRFQAIASAAPDMVSTDIPEAQLSSFVELAQKTRQRDLQELDFVPPEVTPAHPDFTQIHALVQQTIEQSEAESDADAAAGPGSAAGGLGTPQGLAAAGLGMPLGVAAAGTGAPGLAVAGPAVTAAGSGGALGAQAPASASEASAVAAPAPEGEGDDAICYVP